MTVAAALRTAFLLGAGFGTRLRPLTDRCPKPLLPVRGRPLITYGMDHCLTLGVERFIVNTHHLAAAYREAFPDRRWRGRPIRFREEKILLDTAGGLKNIADLLADEERVLVYNGDILSDLPLHELAAAHHRKKREVTLVLRGRGPLTNVGLDEKGEICDFRGRLRRPAVRQVQFAGIYLAERRFLDRLTPGKVESVVEVFLAMLGEAPGSVAGVLIDAGRWRDVGSLTEYEALREGLPEGETEG